MSNIKITPKYEIGTNIKDDFKDIVLTKFIREPGRYAYRYKCNTCGYNGTGGYYQERLVYPAMTEKQLKGNARCSVCSGKVVVPEINSLAAEYPDLIKYFVNKNDAYIHRPQSNVRVELKCPLCGTTQERAIDNLISSGFHCNVCTENKSIGERILREILNQKHEDFIMEYSKRYAEWCKNYRYDFYIQKYNTIIEVHGRQHYIDSPLFINAKKQQEIDETKRQLALDNGIQNYIVIDARKSDFDYIYSSVIKSPLSLLLDLEDIDKSLLKEKVFNTNDLRDVCNYWIQNPNSTINDVCQMFKISDTTARGYLKRGTELGICDFVTTMNTSHYGGNRTDYAHEYSRPIYCPEIKTYFKSIGICSNHSEELLGRHIGDSTIREILKGRRSCVRKINYNFTYVSKEEFNRAVNDANTNSYGDVFIKTAE